MSIRFARTTDPTAPRSGLFGRVLRRSHAPQHQQPFEMMHDAGLRERSLSRVMRDAMSSADLSDRVLG